MQITGVTTHEHYFGLSFATIGEATGAVRRLSELYPDEAAALTELAERMSRYLLRHFDAQAGLVQLVPGLPGYTWSKPFHDYPMAGVRLQAIVLPGQIVLAVSGLRSSDTVLRQLAAILKAEGQLVVDHVRVELTLAAALTEFEIDLDPLMSHLKLLGFDGDADLTWLTGEDAARWFMARAKGSSRSALPSVPRLNLRHGNTTAHLSFTGLEVVAPLRWCRIGSVITGPRPQPGTGIQPAVSCFIEVDRQADADDKLVRDLAAGLSATFTPVVA